MFDRDAGCGELAEDSRQGRDRNDEHLEGRQLEVSGQSFLCPEEGQRPECGRSGQGDPKRSVSRAMISIDRRSAMLTRTVRNLVGGARETRLPRERGEVP